MKVAFIDIGTNSVRYLAVETGPGNGWKLLARGLASPRLGRGLAAGGTLSAAASRQTLNELARITARLRKLGVERFYCVGTEALRRAGNSEEFTAGMKNQGLSLRILSGEEEAELAYRGVQDLLPPGAAVVIDVGGGSSEIITAREGGPAPEYFSLPLGCVRLREKFAGAENMSLPRMAEFTDAFLREQLSHPPAGNVVGLGGTITTLAALGLELSTYQPERIQGCRLTRAAIEKILARLSALSEAERGEIPVLGPRRADIIIPGIVIVRAFLKHLRKKTLIVSDRGILFGMLRQFEEEDGPPSGAAG